ncbi:MFS transporter, partial [Auraticoccus cholistanensis]
MSADVTPTRLSRSQRLDRLPFTRRHARLLGGSGLGWALDAMDVGLISFVMAALGQQWALSSGQVSLVGSIGFVGMAVGASVGGLLADRIGRRQVFALTLLVYGLATGASALSAGLATLIALRFVVGLGLGAELPVASTLVSEYAPGSIRGRVVVALEAFWALGWVMAALIGYFVVPTGPDGWRWALALGAVPAVYAVVVRLGLPESVRFLERRGRHAEAEEAVRGFEQAAGVPAPETPAGPPPLGGEPAGGEPAAPARTGES